MTKFITPIESIRSRFSGAEYRLKEMDAVSLEPCAFRNDETEASIPLRIKTLIENRKAARDAQFRLIPSPGQIVRVPPTAEISGSSIYEYFAVLLDSKITDGTWHGWTVGRDPDYACEWDLILGPEDEPCDPACQVVQVWNPVKLEVEGSARVLAELPADRLMAVRGLARDFAQSRNPTPIDDHRMGVYLARELTDGTGIVTGTPIADHNDPRKEYQQLYSDAARQLSLRTRVSQVASVRSGTTIHANLSSWIEAIFGYPGRMRLLPIAFVATLLTVPTVAFLVLYQSQENQQDTSSQYVSGGAFQKLFVERPEITSREIESTLRAAGLMPEIRQESGGVIIIEADLNSLTEENRKRILDSYRLSVGNERQLRVMILPMTSSVPSR